MGRHCDNCGTELLNTDVKYRLYDWEVEYWLCVDCKQIEDIEISLFGIESDVVYGDFE